MLHLTATLTLYRSLNLTVNTSLDLTQTVPLPRTASLSMRTSGPACGRSWSGSRLLPSEKQVQTQPQRRRSLRWLRTPARTRRNRLEKRLQMRRPPSGSPRVASPACQELRARWTRKLSIPM